MIRISNVTNVGALGESDATYSHFATDSHLDATGRSDEAETLAVEFTVTGIQMVRGSGRLIALANAEVDVAGVVIALHGVQVIREPPGVISVRAPQFRDAGGTWRSAVILPDALRDALGREVLAALPGGAST